MKKKFEHCLNELKEGGRDISITDDADYEVFIKSWNNIEDITIKVEY